MEISMRDLFPACVDVLNAHMVPLHYKDVTKKALDLLGVMPSHVVLNKEAENVREKLLQAGQRGTFYTGPPSYAGALRAWFVSDRQLHLSVDYIAIPGSASAGADGAFEALMRSPHMVIHKPSLANTARLNRARSSGLVLEKHVAQWFRRRYPTLYADPANRDDWRTPCSHDFSLMINGRRYLIDVAGPDDRGSFGKRGRKHPTDLHLLCRISGDECLFEGVVRGQAYQDKIDPHSIFSPTAFVVWLNCVQQGIDYANVALKHERAA